MRLSSLSIAAVLLFSSIAFAQHHEGGSAPSAPPPSPPPAAAPSPAPPPPPPPPAPSPAPSFSNSAPSVSHSSAPSSVPAPSIPERHAAPTPSPSSGPVSGTVKSDSNPEPTAPVAHTPEAERVIPAEKISGEDKIVSAPRVGEHPPEKDRETKPEDSVLRRRVCEGEACKEPVAKPGPPESDLRRRICVNGSCGCPAGQTASKNGCVTTGSTPETHCQPGTVWNGTACATNACQSGMVWNGTTCVPNGQCVAGEIWNGSRCSANCSIAFTESQHLIVELRSLRQKRDEACQQDPGGPPCLELSGSYSTTKGEYLNLWTAAPSECRVTVLPDPGTL